MGEDGQPTCDVTAVHTGRITGLKVQCEVSRMEDNILKDDIAPLKLKQARERVCEKLL